MTTSAANSEKPFHPPGDPAWQARSAEAAIEPDLEIVDAHHHLFDRPNWQYRLEDLLADLGSGHRITATVYLQCGEHYRSDGPQALRPVGETEFVDNAADRSLAITDGALRACAAIVAHADLSLGARVADVLDAHAQASPARFRGIRHGSSHDPDPAFARSSVRAPAGLLAQPEFREGFAQLRPRGLSFDAWLYHPQLDELVALARAHEDTSIILNHVGGPLGIGRYAERRDEIFPLWRRSIAELARCENVVVKLGGLGMRLCGFGFDELATPPTSADLAAAWRPYVETCVEAFGARRAMFESNFPVDGCSCSYGTLWNAFKRIASGCSTTEKAALFRETATRIYRI